MGRSFRARPDLGSDSRIHRGIAQLVADSVQRDNSRGCRQARALDRQREVQMSERFKVQSVEVEAEGISA